MSSQAKPLLVHFKEDRSRLGATRETLKEIADELGVSETKAVHIAINRLHMQIFPALYQEEVSAEAFRKAGVETPQEPIVKRETLADIVG